MTHHTHSTLSDWVSPDRVFVGFHDRTRLRLLSWITRPGFAHCFVYFYDGELDAWMAVELTAMGLDIRPLLDPKGVRYRRWDDVPMILRNCGVLSVAASIHREQRYLNRGLLTCVSLCKHYLGLRAPFVQTPKGLFDLLKEMSAREETKHQEIPRRSASVTRLSEVSRKVAAEAR